ncbi:MAG: transporter substrate-binding domain-containing protein [Burkholderiaceae bacterium]
MTTLHRLPADPMPSRTRRGVLRALTAFAAGAAAPPALHAQGTPPSPGSGFVDPASAPPRERPADVAPVMRPAAVDTLATIRLRGTLRVGVVPVVPMVMIDSRGELTGYSVDLARRLAEDMGVSLEFVPTSWPQVVPDLLDRQFDLIATGFWITVQRALVVNFTDPTAAEGIYLVANRRKAGGRTLLADYDQPGITLAVSPDTPQASLAQRLFPKAKLLTTAGDPLQTVARGAAHATLLPTLAPQLAMRSAPDTLFLPRAQPVSGASAAMALRKGDPDFLNFLNSWLRIRREDGWLEQRAVYWSDPKRTVH